MAAAQAQDAETRQQIIERCRAEMGEQGPFMVKSCVDLDLESLKALDQYPGAARPIIERCKEQMGAKGWYEVKACADLDLGEQELQGLEAKD